MGVQGAEVGDVEAGDVVAGQVGCARAQVVEAAELDRAHGTGVGEGGTGVGAVCGGLYDPGGARVEFQVEGEGAPQWGGQGVRRRRAQFPKLRTCLVPAEYTMYGDGAGFGD